MNNEQTRPNEEAQSESNEEAQFWDAKGYTPEDLKTWAEENGFMTPKTTENPYIRPVNEAQKCASLL